MKTQIQINKQKVTFARKYFVMGIEKSRYRLVKQATFSNLQSLDNKSTLLKKHEAVLLFSLFVVSLR